MAESAAEKNGKERRRKILAVVDSSEECPRAVLYAAAQAKRGQCGLVLLYVIDDSEFHQAFGVGHVMRAEAAERAERAMRAAAETVKSRRFVKPELVIREGRAQEEIAALAAADRAIAVLILAAGSYHDGPGPLIEDLVGRHSSFSLPVTVIPAGLSEAELEALA